MGGDEAHYPEREFEHPDDDPASPDFQRVLFERFADLLDNFADAVRSFARGQ